MFFFVVFIDLERQSLLSTYPEMRLKSCSSPRKFRLVSWIDFKSLRKMFLRGQEAERRRRIKM